MKKLFTLLFIAPFLFSACGDDEEEKPYFNPVEGEWVYSLDDDYTATRVFTINFRASTIINNNGKESEVAHGMYTINKDYIQYKETGNKHHYTIVEDTLHLIHKESGWEKKYIRSKAPL